MREAARSASISHRLRFSGRYLPLFFCFSSRMVPTCTFYCYTDVMYYYYSSKVNSFSRIFKTHFYGGGGGGGALNSDAKSIPLFSLEVVSSVLPAVPPLTVLAPVFSCAPGGGHIGGGPPNIHGGGTEYIFGGGVC